MNDQTKGYTMDTIEILRAARALIDTPEKWLSFSRPGGGLCVAQSFIRTLDTYKVHPAQEAFARAAGVSDARGALYAWNDSPQTTHSDVLAAFDRAIAYESAKAEEFTLEPVLA